MVTITKSADMFKNRKTSILSIGDSRTGKTYFLGTMCAHEKVLIIDVEGGLSTIEGKSFDSVRVKTFKEFKEALNWYMSGGYNDYTMLSIDSINRVQAMLATELSPDGTLTQNQWGEVLATLRKILDVLSASCPTAFHVTSMAMESKDELTGRIRIYPNIQGSFKFDLTGYFDTVLYHHAKPDTKGDTQYYCQLQGDTRVIAGSRLVKLKGIKNIHCDYGEMLSLINKE
jgi:hypothetical protein